MPMLRSLGAPVLALALAILTTPGPAQAQTKITIGKVISGNGFHRAGTVNVAASTTVASVIGGIPFGTGYQLQLTMQDVDHKLTPCTGSSTFAITSTGTIPVPVHLTCHEVPVAPPVAVPVPRWASVAFAALLVGVGSLALRRRRDRAA